MSASSKWWNEALGYIRWGDARFTNPRTYDDFRDLIDNADDSLGYKEVSALFKQVLKFNDPILLDKVRIYLAKEFKHLFGKKTINKVINSSQTYNKSKKEKPESKSKDAEDVFESIVFDAYDIEIREEGVFKIVWRKDETGELHPFKTDILKGKLEVLFKTYDTALDVDRFTFRLNGILYNTYSIMNMIRKCEDKIYEGTHGRDIIKKVFNHLSDKIENRKPEYIIGFNNGWKLPQREEEGKYAIITYTDIDRVVYKNAIKCIKNYNDKEKQLIIEKLKLFITTTQTPPVKLLKIVIWAIASVFRMTIIDFFKVFPILYNYGERTAGKGALEEFWIVHFYGLQKKLLPSKTIESASRLEDYLASSTFPIAITEADGSYIRNTLSIIKEHASDNTDFERKKNATELEFRKTKTAGLCFDSNNIIEAFNDPALNSKCVMNEFKKNDVPRIDFEWKRRFRELKKEKLFSFVYENTKEWDNQTCFDIFDKIIKETKENLPEYETIEKRNPRILSIYQVYLFGFYIWHHCFGFSLEELLGIEKTQLLESLISGRKIIPSNLLDQFYRFCLTAIDFDEGDINDFGTIVKGNNPKYLTCALEQHKDGFHYAFTQDNIRDFNEYVRNYNKNNYTLKELANKLEDGLDDKEYIVYKNCRAFDNKKMDRIIMINKEWLE